MYRLRQINFGSLPSSLLICTAADKQEFSFFSVSFLYCFKFERERERERERGEGQRAKGEGKRMKEEREKVVERVMGRAREIRESIRKGLEIAGY